ncbi:hypothetical protein [Photorhabdus asymbiotica]|uniref:hypothetical protein n=1 Tax=Photorhabdus asymbiotica TaxID=291112 RepID=UPI003DA6E218
MIQHAVFRTGDFFAATVGSSLNLQAFQDEYGHSICRHFVHYPTAYPVNFNAKIQILPVSAVVRRWKG